jgi:hypothetical protein
MAASTIEGDYIGQAEAFDSRELTGMTLRSAVPGDAWDLVRIEGARGSNFPQLHPGQRPVPINEPAFFDLVVAANGSKRQQQSGKQAIRRAWAVHTGRVRAILPGQPHPASVDRHRPSV